MAIHPKSADLVEDYLQTLIRLRLTTSEILNYIECLRAIQWIVPCDTPQYFAAAVAHISLVEANVPWAAVDWEAKFPQLADLRVAAELLPSSNSLRIPAQGLGSYPALAALRRHSYHFTHDDHARALLISLAARIPCSEDDPLERSRQQQQRPCLQILSSRIRGLNREDSRAIRNRWLEEAYQQSSSAESYLIAFAKSCLRAPDPDTDLCNALAIDAMKVFGLPPLAVPKKRREKSVPEPADPADPVDPVEPPVEAEPELREPRIIKLTLVRVQDPDDTSPEAQDENTTTLHLVRNRQPTKTPPSFASMREVIRREYRSQNIPSPGELFLPHHIDALSFDQAQLATKGLLELATDCLRKKRTQEAASYGTLLLVLCTGFTADRVTALLSRPTSGPAPHLAGSCLTLRSMLPDSAFAPKGPNSHLVKSAGEFSVRLPPALVNLLSKVRIHLMQDPIAEKIQDSLGNSVRNLRQHVGLPNITVGRLRNANAILIHEKTQDYCATATLTQNTFRQSPAPLHYYSAQADVLAGLYQQAIWPLFSADTPKKETENSNTARVGTLALACSSALRRTAKAASKSLHTHTDPDDPVSLAKAHNAITAHLSAMLMGVVGHRFSSSLFKLNRWDFDLALGAANIRDKMSDPAHLRRLVGLGNKVATQVALYLLHLNELGELGTKDLKAHSRAVLQGKKPLLFRLNDQGAPRDADLKWFTSQVDTLSNIRTH